MAPRLSSIVLIVGQDSLRSDRALAACLAERKAEDADVTRLWGDECTLVDAFRAATSRSLFADRTVVVVRRAERFKDLGRPEEEDETPPDGESEAPEAAAPTPTPEPESPGRAGKVKTGRGARDAGPEVPELDPGSFLILVARKVDGRIAAWKKIRKAAEVIDVDYFKGRALLSAAGSEARSLGLRIDEELLSDIVDQSGPSLGRILSELEKLALFQQGSGRSTDATLASTSAPPLYLLSDAIQSKRRRESLALLDEALRQGEHGLRVLSSLHGSVRRLAAFRSLRRQGMSATEAGQAVGLMPFKIADVDRAARNWGSGEIARALATLAEVDRRIKLSAPASPALTHAVARLTLGERS